MSNKGCIYIGSDHAGYELKRALIMHLEDSGREMIDLGTDSTASVDYPDYGKLVAEKVAAEAKDPSPPIGIVICGSGIGISIAANKVRGIRCALIHDHYTAEVAKKHNNANVIAMGGRVVKPELAKEMVDIFLSNQFEERHSKRIEKIHQLEK